MHEMAESYIDSSMDSIHDSMTCSIWPVKQERIDRDEKRDCDAKAS